MEVRTIGEGERRGLECTSGLQGVGDVLDLVGECAGHGATGVLIAAENLPEEFFRLKTGLAGEVLQKLQNYGIRLAGVISQEQAESGRFGEFVREANRGRAFRFFATRAEAEAWLLAD